VWEGVRIGSDIYCCIGRKPYQFRSKDNPHKVKLGYHGVIYSNTNAPAVSMMDRMRPFQHLYFVIMHRLKHLIAQDHAPVFNLDVTQIDPKIGLEKTMYYLNHLNVHFYNPLQNAEKEGAYQRGAPGSTADRSTIAHINNYIQILDAIDAQIADVAGVTKQREGQSVPYESVTNHQQAIVQSTHVTEYYFNLHDKNWEHILNTAVQAAQECWAYKGITRQYVLDDMSLRLLKVDKGELLNADIGVFITNSSKENEIFNRMAPLAEYALNHDKAKLTDIVNMYKAKSVTEMEQYLKDAERTVQEAEERQRQHEQQLQQEALRADQEKQEREYSHDKEMAMIERDTELMKKEIDAFKFQQDLDMNNDGIPDPLQVEKLKQDGAIKNRELDLKEKELEIKKKEAENKRAATE